MIDISNLNCLEECKDWLSKKELASMCNVNEKTIQRAANDILSMDTGIHAQ